MASPAIGAEGVHSGLEMAVAGTATFVHDAGAGAPVLLLHGSGPGVSAWANWRVVLPELAREFRVIAPDQLGFGATGRPAGGHYGREAWTAHAIALLEALDLDRVSVIGNSMGGAVALSVAAARPDLVDRLILMGTVGVPFELTAGLDRVWGYEPSREGMRELIELFAADPGVATEDLVELRYAQSAEPRARASYEAMFPAPRQRWVDDLALDPDELRALEVPTLLIHGREDRVIPLATSLQALELLPDAELHVFKGCGHWVQIERTRRFLAIAGDFLRPDPS